MSGSKALQVEDIGQLLRELRAFISIEAAFHEETAEERDRHERLRREAIRRSRVRRQQRVARHSTARFIGLVLAIIGTTVLVTVVMFQMLALWFA